MANWTEAVDAAMRRLAAKSSDGSFTRAQLEADELPRIIADTGTAGTTPMQTVSRELQQLRDAGIIEFLDDQGTYRLK